MNDIICPSCKKAFKVDEAGFADILKQVRDHEFEHDLNKRLALAENEKINAVKLAEANIKNSLQEQLSKKDHELTLLKAKSDSDLAAKLAAKEREINELKSQSERALAEQLAKKEAEISDMKSKIQNAEIDKKLTVGEAIRAIEKERDNLASNLKIKETE